MTKRAKLTYHSKRLAVPLRTSREQSALRLGDLGNQLATSPGRGRKELRSHYREERRSSQRAQAEDSDRDNVCCSGQAVVEINRAKEAGVCRSCAAQSAKTDYSAWQYVSPPLPSEEYSVLRQFNAT